jgi:formate dehydrogenase gamma subunit
MQASALPVRLQRFSRSERALHWVIAVTVIPMILSGLALGINIWHPEVFVIHIGSLFALLAAVLLVVVLGNRQELGRLWRQLRRFDDSDWEWLEAAPRSLVGGPVPPVGRFNAGQKLNGVLMPLLLAVSTVTGLYLWAGQVHHLVTRIDVLGGLHNLAAIGIIALVSGHLYMAVLNPGTRHALRGITAGDVDREWAVHHHALWVADVARGYDRRMPPEQARELASGPLGLPDGQFVIVSWRDPGGETGPDRPIAGLHVHHEDDEAWYVLEGSLGFQLGERTVHAPAGTAVYAPRGTPHSFWNDGDGEPAAYLLVMTPRIHHLVRSLHDTSNGPVDYAEVFREHASELL